MQQFAISRKQHWVFLIVFSLCALVGLTSVVVAELYLPRNAGGIEGRLAIYRSLGLITLAWTGIAVWSASALWTQRKSEL